MLLYTGPAGRRRRCFGLPSLGLLLLLTLARFAFAGDGDVPAPPPPPAPSKALFLDNENDVGDMRWDLIAGEKKEIMAAYFLWDGNRVGLMHLAGLREAARRGVKVRMFYDGNMPEGWTTLVDEEVTRAQMKALADAGVDIRIYNPLNFYDVRTYTQFKGLDRMHDKLLVLGGGELLATGDRNAQNINFRSRISQGNAGKSYRSAETLVSGPAAAAAQSYIDDLWNSPDAKKPDFANLSEKDVRRANEKMDRIKSVLTAARHVPRPWREMLQPVDEITFLHDDASQKGRIFKQEPVFLDAIQKAEDRITITAPYIHLTPDFEEAVVKALERGVKVRIVTASRESTDAPIMSLVFEPQARRLREAGAGIFEHMGPDFMHAKTLEVDGKMAYVGSYNFSHRSVYHDLESGVLIKGKQYVESVQAYHDLLIKKESQPICLEAKCILQVCSDVLTRMIINSNSAFQRNF